MVKSIVEIPATKLSFPRIMEYSNPAWSHNIYILLNSQTQGTVVSETSKEMKLKIGDYRTDWIWGFFNPTPIETKVILSND